MELQENINKFDYHMNWIKDQSIKMNDGMFKKFIIGGCTLIVPTLNDSLVFKQQPQIKKREISKNFSSSSKTNIEQNLNLLKKRIEKEISGLESWIQKTKDHIRKRDEKAIEKVDNEDCKISFEEVKKILEKTAMEKKLWEELLLNNKNKKIDYHASCIKDYLTKNNLNPTQPDDLRIPQEYDFLLNEDNEEDQQIKALAEKLTKKISLCDEIEKLENDSSNYSLKDLKHLETATIISLQNIEDQDDKRKKMSNIIINHASYLYLAIQKNQESSKTQIQSLIHQMKKMKHYMS